MMRSLFAGVSGLRNHQIKMDVIGNNVANVNTIGFKAGRVTFRDMLYQTLLSGSSPQGTRGGINPQQVGFGVGIASIDTLMTPGPSMSTGVNTDLFLDGDGFFVLTDGYQNFYTRAGAFTTDDNGWFANRGDGLKVRGWMPDPATGVVDPTTSAPKELMIQVGQQLNPSATTGVVYGDNLDSRVNAATGAPVSTTKTIFDSQGNTHDLVVTFDKTADNQWAWTATIDAAAAGGGTIAFGLDGRITTAPPTGTVTAALPGVLPINATLDFTNVTQFAAETAIGPVSQNGYAKGSLERFTFDSYGKVIGTFSNGVTKEIGQIAIAVFNNSGGLLRAGNSLFLESNNSGQAQVGTALTGGRGKVTPGALEMSNVDLANEFTDMIVTQRGFQANSRVITTSDEMLQDLMTLKR